MCAAQTSDSKEYKVKAIFLFNFAQFMEWPEDSFAHEKAPFVLGILGENLFGTFLKETIINEKIEGHPLVIEHYNEISEVNGCHILFVHTTQVDQMNAMADHLKYQHVLTVGESRDFITKGGVVRFFMKGGKIRLEINVQAAEAAGLVISSKLLGVSQIVKS